jgi:predicted enzyme related to lactoylglutathione lyase
MLVESVDQSVEAVQRAGGTLAHAKDYIPGMGWSAYLLDPDGNQFGVFQAEMPERPE